MSDTHIAKPEDPLGDLIRTESSEQIARILFPQVRKIARRYLTGRDPHLIETAAGDAVLAVCRYRSTFRGQAKASTWIYRIAIREAYRQGRRETSRSGPMVSWEEETGRGTPRVIPMAEFPSLSAREAMAAVEELIPNASWRRIWLLWNSPGPRRSHAEVAALTGYTPASVGVILSRVRGLLNNLRPGEGERL